MDERERRPLLGGLLRISGSRNKVRPVELTVVVQSDVRPWRYPPNGDFLYGQWLRADDEAGAIPGPEPMHDLALPITMALAKDHPLTGPRLAEVLDPVPHSHLVRASVAGIPDLLDGELNRSAQQCCEPIGWGVVVENSPGSVVEAFGDAVEVLLGAAGHGGALGEVLA